jgi:hypothetical protein
MMAALTRLCKSRSAVLFAAVTKVLRAYTGTRPRCDLPEREKGVGPPLASLVPHAWQMIPGPAPERDYLVQLGLTIVNCATFRSKYLFPPASDFSLGSVFASSVFDRGIS